MVSRICVLLALALMLSTPVPSVSASPTQDRPDVRRAMSALLDAGATGVQIRIGDHGAQWVAGAGVAHRDGPDPVPVDGRFRIGSITKTFVATVVLQLVAEGRLSLDDPVVRHLPGFALDPRITVRMILRHTSGLRTHTTELLPDGTAEPGIGDDLTRSWDAAELVRFALSRPSRFEPGAGWAYSNTNYVLAGLLIERLTGTPYAWQVYLRLVVPLGLWRTELPGTNPEIFGPHARGYVPLSEHEIVDYTRLDPSFVGASGEIISTTADLDIFATALHGDRLLPPALTAEMRDFHPAVEGLDYGLGLMRQTFGSDCVAYGHYGRMPGYASRMFTTVDGSTRVTISATEGRRFEGDPEFAGALVRLLATALCGTHPPADLERHLLPVPGPAAW